jgi:hypothetical protein
LESCVVFYLADRLRKQHNSPTLNLPNTFQLSNTMWSGVTQSAMSVLTFSNATMYMSRATSCDVTQVLVAPRTLARPKGLVLGILVWEMLFLKF